MGWVSRVATELRHHGGRRVKKNPHPPRVGDRATGARESGEDRERREHVGGGVRPLRVGAGLREVAVEGGRGDRVGAAERDTHHDAHRAVPRPRARGSDPLRGPRVADPPARVRRRRGARKPPPALSAVFPYPEPLGEVAVEKVLPALSPPRPAVGLPPVPRITATSSATTNSSAVSRRVVTTATAPAEVLPPQLSARLELVAMIVGGVHSATRCCVVALSDNVGDNQPPAAVVGGSTDLTAVTGRLVVRLRGRRLEIRPPMVVRVGASAPLHAAVDEVVGPAILRR